MMEIENEMIRFYLILKIKYFYLMPILFDFDWILFDFYSFKAYFENNE